MTNQDKTNQSKGNAQGGQAANQGKQGDPAEWNAQKTGQTGKKEGQGGSQMGGKNPPTGGPDQYKPNEPMEGKGNVGGKGGATDPYPPTNPERPVMAGGKDIQGQSGQGKNLGSETGGQQGGQFKGGQGGQFGANVGGTVGGTGIDGAKGNVGSDLEEEEE